MRAIILSLMLFTPNVLWAKGLDAGCVNPTGEMKNSKIPQSGLLITNAISSPITSTAMASGTSGCKVKGFAQEVDREAGIYLANHINELKWEIASGQRQYLLAFEDLVGCGGQTERVLDSLRAEESPLTQGPAQSGEAFYSWLHELKGQCRI